MNNMTVWVGAAKFALERAAAVLWGGSVAVVIYFSVITFGPGIEATTYPPVRNYTIAERSVTDDNAVVFRARFLKVRDCPYLGTTWFADREDGLPIRVQAQQEFPTSPLPGPLGQRIGQPNTIYPPEGSTSFFGYLNYDCGWPWVTKVKVGPFPIADWLVPSGRNTDDNQ